MILYFVREDQPSEDVIKKLVDLILPQTDYWPINTTRGGFGHIKTNIKGYYQSFVNVPCFVLTDLDDRPCAPGLMTEWLGQSPPYRSNFIFRVAVREVEAWLLADHGAIAKFLGLNKEYVSREIIEADRLPDPKLKLLQLALRTKKSDLQKDMLRLENGSPRQGPAYNMRIGEYISKYWDIRNAAVFSDSLKRAVNALKKIKRK